MESPLGLLHPFVYIPVYSRYAPVAAVAPVKSLGSLLGLPPLRPLWLPHRAFQAQESLVTCSALARYPCQGPNCNTVLSLLGIFLE
jgi:hypothetical protein